MPSLKPYTLHFRGGLHLGTRGINLGDAAEFIPSDTLFAAILDVWNRLGGDVEKFISLYETADPPFLLTSAFPFAGGVRFFPVPADLRRIFSAGKLEDPDWRKPLRKIRYLSEGLLRKALDGSALDPDLFRLKESQEPGTGLALQGGSLWLLKEEMRKLPKYFQMDERGNDRSPKALRYLKLWGEGKVPRVTIDRIAQTSTLYHAGRVTFAAGCGLWFGVQWRKEDEFYKDALARSLGALQDDGLGGERSSGYGAFELNDEAVFPLPDAKLGEAGFLLSRYHPTGNELPNALQSEYAAYKLINVGGWLHTHDEADQRRKKLWMVEAGGLVQMQKDVQGSIEDVKPEYEDNAPEFPHPIWRYGFALPVGGLAEVK